MKEFEWIGRLERRLRPVEGVWLGVGDDTAVLEPGRFDLITVDTVVEDVHFRRGWSSAEAVGWKLAASNLSDIAAMGGAPGPFLLSLALNAATDARWVEGLLEGIEAAVAEHVPAGFEVGLIGGDTTQTRGPLVLTMTLLGETPPAGPILRSGATPGDRIFLIGAVGESAAGLHVLQALPGASVDSPDRTLDEGALAEPLRRLVAAHRFPPAYVKAGALLGLHGLANALIDISDGLVQDLGHILRRSRVGARVEAERIPISPDLRAAAAEYGASALDWALAGGEDYALLASVSPDRAAQLMALAAEHELPVCDIGEIREIREGFRCVDVTGAVVELGRAGWEHEFGGGGGERA